MAVARLRAPAHGQRSAYAVAGWLLMRAQASATNLQRRKQIFDRVQELGGEQQPFIYLVHKNSLSAIANTVRGADPVALSPQTYWNIERISLLSEGAAK